MMKTRMNLSRGSGGTTGGGPHVAPPALFVYVPLSPHTPHCKATIARSSFTLTATRCCPIASADNWSLRTQLWNPASFP